MLTRMWSHQNSPTLLWECKIIKITLENSITVSFLNHAVLSFIKHKDFQSHHLKTILPIALFGHQSFVSLFSNGEADTLSKGERKPRFVAFANNKGVGEPSGKALALASFTPATSKEPGCLSLSVGDYTSSSQVGIPGHHSQITSAKLDESSNLSSLRHQCEWCPSP